MNFDEVFYLHNLKKKASKCFDYQSIKALDIEISNHFGKATLDLPYKHYANINNRYDSYEKDAELVVSFIDGVISKDSNSSLFNEIISFIDEAENADTLEKQYSFIRKVYSAFSGNIEFDECCKSIAIHPAGKASAVNVYINISYEIIEGIVIKLKNYVRNVLTEKEKKAPLINITNNNNQSLDLNVSISIEEVKKQIDDIGLPPAQLDEVNKKLDYLQAVLSSKESRSKKWGKVGEILKWLTEQSIQVASIIVPLLPQIIKQEANPN